MNKDTKFFIFRITIIFILLICINLVSKSNTNNIDFSKLQQDYTKEKKITKYDMQIGYLKVFFDDLANEKYDLAYNMLSDETKTYIFSNNIETFKKIIKERYFDSSIVEKKVIYADMSKDNSDKNVTYITAYILIKNIDDYAKMKEGQEKFFSINSIKFTVTEKSPFNYSLSITGISDINNLND